MQGPDRRIAPWLRDHHHAARTSAINDRVPPVCAEHSGEASRYLHGHHRDVEQELVLQEIMQQYILASLSKNGFFNEAQFHGGTFLKICHNLKRFSENLDFVLKKENTAFQWESILRNVKN